MHRMEGVSAKKNWLEHSYVIGEDNLHFNVVLFL